MPNDEINRNTNNSNKNRKTSKKKKVNKKKIWKAVFFTILWGIIIVIGLGVGVIYAIFQGAGELPLDQFEINQFTTIIYDKDGKEYAKLDTSENRIYVKLSEMSPYLPKAFIAIEDERFESHFGIDIKRTLAATVNYVLHGDSDFGGSTITQQLIKKVTQDQSRSWQRKVREMVRAIQLEQKMSKDEIIERYMNIIFLGENSYGVEMAAYTYFNKSAADLSIAECAMIGGLAQAPSSVNPFSNYEAAKARQQLVLGKMHELGFITDEQYEEAKAEELVVNKGAMSGGTVTSYFTDAVIEEVIEDFAEEFGVDKGEAQRMLYSNGYKIYTTVDPNIQKAMEDVYANKDYFKLTNGKYDENVQSAMVVIDYAKGNVVGLVGGSGVKTTQRGLNRATQSYRQPGSTMKPLGAYGPALENGIITIADTFDDVKTTFNVPGSGPWTPSNSTGYKGTISVKKAIAASQNVVAAKVFMELGSAASRKFLIDLGITSLTSSDVGGGSLALGGMYKGICPLEHAAAYGTIANGGIYMEPKLYTKILDRNDNVIIEKVSTVRQVMTKQNAYLLTTCLQAVITSGTGGGAGITNMSTAGKTGTSNESKDRWFAGYTPYYVASTWVGYDTPKNVPMSGNPAGKIWKAVMSKIHEGLPGRTFTRPSGLVSCEVCADSGKIPTELCKNDPRGSRVTTELFTTDTVPTEECTMHVAVEVCPDSYKLMNPTCAKTVKPVTRVFLNKKYDTPPNPLPDDYAYIIPPTYCTVHAAEQDENGDWVDDYPITNNDSNNYDDEDDEDNNDILDDDITTNETNNKPTKKEDSSNYVDGNGVPSWINGSY